MNSKEAEERVRTWLETLATIAERNDREDLCRGASLRCQGLSCGDCPLDANEARDIREAVVKLPTGGCIDE